MSNEEKRKRKQAEYKRKWRRESPSGQLSHARANYKYQQKKYKELLKKYKDQEEILTEEDKFYIRFFGIEKQE